MIGDHGSRVKYHHEVLGFNSRLDALQAVVLKAKLRHLERLQLPPPGSRGAVPASFWRIWI